MKENKYFVCEFVNFRGYEDHNYSNNYTIVFFVNLSKDELKKAFLKGAKKLKIDVVSLGQRSREDGINVCCVILTKDKNLKKFLSSNIVQ